MNFGQFIKYLGSDAQELIVCVCVYLFARNVWSIIFGTTKRIGRLTIKQVIPVKSSNIFFLLCVCVCVCINLYCICEFSFNFTYSDDGLGEKKL